jgi:hypothetical protein
MQRATHLPGKSRIDFDQLGREAKAERQCRGPFIEIERWWLAILQGQNRFEPSPALLPGLHHRPRPAPSVLITTGRLAGRRSRPGRCRTPAGRPRPR